MKPLAEPLQNNRNILLRIHDKISSWTAHLIGPIVFNFGPKQASWNMHTADLLKFPKGTVGRALGEFLQKDKLELIAGAESHDLYHLLFGFSTSFKDEVALQFFLRGNGKKSIASFGTSIGAWLILPTQWSYLKKSYTRGKNCMDISKIDARAILSESFEEVGKCLINENKGQNG